jgi:rubrerythrin
MKVLDFAMDMDRRGRDFYRLLARRAQDSGAREVFARLAEEEERLLEGYRRMRLAHHEEIDSPVLEEGKTPYFARPVSRAAGRDPIAAYRLALEMEGKVCNFLQNAAAREEDGSARELLGQVAATECGELTEIEHLFDFINAPNEYLAWGEFSNLDEFHNFGRYEDNRGCGHTL